MTASLQASENTVDDVKKSLKPGDIFAGKYRIERVLGEGGMGVVIAATHMLTNDRVALKFLLPRAAWVPEVRQRFLNEARAAVQIKSEHVVRVTDADATPAGLPFMVMEYLEGKDLGAIIAQGGGLALGTAVDYVLQACEALAEAHALGIIHRDLKPSNLFLTHRKDGSPLVKVLDFGISKLNTAPGEQQLTRTRGGIGSPLYMSPEQMTNPRGVDARSDVWSLGVVLYELLTGSWPFKAETVEGQAIEIATKAHRPVRAVRGDLPGAIEAIIGRCLEKDPARRMASIVELTEALAPFGSAQAMASAERVSRVLRLPAAASGGEQVTADPLLVLPVPPDSATPREPSRVTPHKTWASTQSPDAEAPAALAKNRGAWSLYGGVAGLLAALGLGLALRRDSATAASEAASAAIVAPTAATAATATGSASASADAAPAPATSNAPAASGSIDPPRREKPAAVAPGKKGPDPFIKGKPKPEEKGGPTDFGGQ